MAFDTFQTGPQAAATADGTNVMARSGRQQDLMVSELHGRFYEQAFRGNLFRGGATLTAINNATFTTATTGATATPIIGLFNPSTSSVNLVVLQVAVSAVLTALTATGPGGFVWMTSTGNSAISTGTLGTNCKTLLASGGQGKVIAGATALTGLTNALATQFGSLIGVGQEYNVSEVSTAVGFMTQAHGELENFDGQVIVPPGAVLAMMATTTPVAHSVVASALWEEVPV